MFRRILRIVTISAGLLVLVTGAGRVAPLLASSDFVRYSRAIRNSELPVSSFERILFSLMLSSSRHTSSEI